jgi:hypothetical protein
MQLAEKLDWKGLRITEQHMNKKMYISLHVKDLIFLPVLNDT